MAKDKCDCIKLVNESLQEEFAGIYLRTLTNLSTGTQKPIIAAERRVGKGRKVPPISPSYCPFCGVKFDED